MNRILMIVVTALSLLSPVHAASLDDTEFQRNMVELSKSRWDEVVMEVSAFTSSEGGRYGAWGKELAVGDVASDDFPKGTVMIVDGKEYVVNDVFGGGYVGRLDIYMDDYEAAMEFGRRTMKVKVIR